MDPAAWSMIAACILIETSEQSLYRLASRAASKARFLIPAILLHALGLVFWLLLLRRAPLGLVLPLMGANFVAIALAGRLFFAERLTPRRWLGIALIVVGFALVAVNM